MRDESDNTVEVRHNRLMDPVFFWPIFLLGFVAPFLHVLLSPKSGAWLPAPGAKCPFGPRIGWLIMVLMLGPIGWLLYIRAKHRHSA